MSRSDDFSLNPAELIHLFAPTSSWWAIPAVACAVLAAAYSLVAPREWRATQTLTVRPEAASVSEQRLGKFSDLSEMKVLQETILELAKSQSVVEATLKKVGPPKSWFAASSELADRPATSKNSASRSTCVRPAAPNSARPKCSTCRCSTRTAIGPPRWLPRCSTSSNCGCKASATSGPRA